MTPCPQHTHLTKACHCNSGGAVAPLCPTVPSSSPSCFWRSCQSNLSPLGAPVATIQLLAPSSFTSHQTGSPCPSPLAQSSDAHAIAHHSPRPQELLYSTSQLPHSLQVDHLLPHGSRGALPPLLPGIAQSPHRSDGAPAVQQTSGPISPRFPSPQPPTFSPASCHTSPHPGDSKSGEVTLAQSLSCQQQDQELFPADWLALTPHSRGGYLCAAP